MDVDVRMESVGNGKIRVVSVPDSEWENCFSLAPRLGKIFKYGQNDFQPQYNIPSVSVGDVILLDGMEYRVDSFGFSKRITGGYASGKINVRNGIVWLEIV